MVAARNWRHDEAALHPQYWGAASVNAAETRISAESCCPDTAYDTRKQSEIWGIVVRYITLTVWERYSTYKNPNYSLLHRTPEPCPWEQLWPRRLPVVTVNLASLELLKYLIMSIKMNFTWCVALSRFLIICDGCLFRVAVCGSFTLLTICKPPYCSDQCFWVAWSN